MPVCPRGHDTADDEFCDVCGLALDSSGGSDVSTPEPVPAAVEPAPEPTAKPCPSCGAPLEGRFCESCGSDSLATPMKTTAPEEPAPAVAWSVVVSADRAYYDTVVAEAGPDADPVEFPLFCPERRFSLRGNQLSIGRRSVSRGIMPDIDLTGPPEDSGVSRMHALLVADGAGWSIVDMDSANGTYVGNSRTALKPNTPHPLREGDRVHLGAWTTLTLAQG